jgi:hypothetical protein
MDFHFQPVHILLGVDERCGVGSMVAANLLISVTLLRFPTDLG